MIVRFGAAAALLLAVGARPAPELTPAFFAAHRERLLQRLPAGSVAVFHAAPESNAETTPDPYRQDSTFFWLTGFPEPNSVAVIRRDPAAGPRYVLFVAPRDFASEQWTGYRAGVESARKSYAADEAFASSELEKKLPELLRGASQLVIGDGGDAAFRAQALALWRPGDPNAVAPRPVADAAPIVNQLRLIKDETEVGLLRRAAELSVEAHLAAMRATRPGVHEYTLKAAMLQACVAGGAARMAYPPIVGAGRNSVILHHETASAPLLAGDMIVNDTACEYSLYAADVTRSYPVSGRFTPEQRTLYALVLAAQKAAMAKVRPGIALHEVHDASVVVIVDGLLKLGLLQGDRAEILKSRSYQKFYPHGCSHWLGLNVHDVGSYGYPENVERLARYGQAKTLLEPGMALTVEPGVYVPEGASADKRLWNIGVRIEDDLVVTPSGYDCLSCAAPREIADLERALAGK